jgi:hypothetical protein
MCVRPHQRSFREGVAAAHHSQCSAGSGARNCSIARAWLPILSGSGAIGQANGFDPLRCRRRLARPAARDAADDMERDVFGQAEVGDRGAGGVAGEEASIASGADGSGWHRRPLTSGEGIIAN